MRAIVPHRTRPVASKTRSHQSLLGDRPLWSVKGGQDVVLRIPNAEKLREHSGEGRHFSLASLSKTVMLIHGAWLTPAEWDKLRGRYQVQGYTVHAPAWPLEDVPIEELRHAPHPDLAKITISKIADHMTG